MVKKIFAALFIILHIRTGVSADEARLRFIAAGDSIIHAVIIEDARERGGFTDMYAPVRNIIKSADISLINVETPIAGEQFEYAGYPRFNTPKENGYALAELFNIINIANNHMLDCGEAGYANHIEFWESQDVLLIGGFKRTQDFENVRVYAKNGVSIAFLSYTYGTNGISLPEGSEMLVPVIDERVIERQIKQARPLADLLFVVMHWGEEDEHEPSKYQRGLARLMADSGADLIIGMHPHVLQEISWLARAGGGRALVAYSLGNFISAQLSAHNLLGGLLELDIVKKDGQARLENARIIPVVTHYDSRRKGLRVYRLEDYGLEHEHGCIDEHFTRQHLINLSKHIIAPEFLGDCYKY